MLLVIDIGNTNTSLGVFDGDHLVVHWRLTTERSRTVDEWGVHARNLFALGGLDFKTIDAIAIASVVPPLNFTLKRMAESYFNLTPLFVDHSVNTGVPILYEPPSDVGADRIVDAVAAIQKYGAPCIIVDFGTATTFDAINAKGEYLGGVITPGITISADALFARAAKLPRVEIKDPRKVIGTNTVTHMQAGLYYGAVDMVDGMLARIKAELGGKPKVVATGGQAKLVAKGSKHIESTDEFLTLEGLRLIWDKNQITETAKKLEPKAAR